MLKKIEYLRGWVKIMNSLIQSQLHEQRIDPLPYTVAGDNTKKSLEILNQFQIMQIFVN